MGMGLPHHESSGDPAGGPGRGASAEFVALLTGSQRRLYAFILALTRNPADADDVLQETNLVLWRKSDQFAPGSDFDAWSLRVAQFQVMAHRKRRQRSRLHFDDELVERVAADAGEVLAGFDARREALAHCLRRLRPEQRRLVAERYQPGGCVNELAARQGRSPKAVSEALRRIRRVLLECIERTLARQGEAGA